MKRHLSFSEECDNPPDKPDKVGTADKRDEDQPDTTSKEGRKTPRRRAAKSKPAKKQKVEEAGRSKTSPETGSTAPSPKVSKAPPPPPPAKSGVPQLAAPPKAAPKTAVPAVPTPKAAAETSVATSESKATKSEEVDQGDKLLRDILNRARTVDALEPDAHSQLGSVTGSDATSRKSKKGQKKLMKRDKKTHALKMRFYRSLGSYSSPDEVHDLATSARTGPKKAQKMQVLFEQWLSAGEDWSKSKLVQSMQSKKSFQKRGARRWFTRQELALKYKDAQGSANYNVADEIIKEKKKDPTSAEQCVRKHPDAPEVESLTQYLCFDEEVESDQQDVVLTSLFQGVADAGRNRKSKKDKKRKKDSSSDSSPSSDEESDSSSDDDKSSDESSSESNRKSKKSKKGKKAKKSKKAKSKKGKKGKKQSKEAKAKQEAKDRKRDADKKEQEIRSAAKKVLTSLQSNIQDIAKKEAKTRKLSQNVQAVLLPELQNFKDPMLSAREKLQKIIDDDEVDGMKQAGEHGKAQVQRYLDNKSSLNVS